MHTEEYVPHTIPTMSGRANSLIEVTPNTYSAATIIKVVSEVKILLESVWLILLLTSSSSVSFLSIDPRFSLIRSKITIVALIE